MELDTQSPNALPLGVAWRPIKVQVTATREFTVRIHPNDPVKDIEYLVLSQVAEQGLQITGITEVEVSTEEKIITAGNEILSTTVKERAVLHMFNPDVSYPAWNRLRANQPNKIPLWKDDDEQQSAQPKTLQKTQGKGGKKQTLLTQYATPRQLSQATPQTSSGAGKLENFSSVGPNRGWNSTVLFKDGNGREDTYVKLSARQRKKRAMARGMNLTQDQMLNAGFARRAERQGIAKALEHRSRRRAKRVEKRLSAAAQRRWQGKSLTEEAKIDALNEALEKM
ncbi:hypothetical protein EDD37DRAFT_607937 [Exophiala viscosa]|uniref:Uncharacterized protein n=1 Tax=Exophiala viscosa TaxID=2486360 RepID=A0AAN6ICX9_9EURO|nr:hypothetical protein EDD36DRAFT_465427 [Exophiala viscosa]KAI1626371.1 hypothetical protein EDD37DRAFT_607937 [Exophiala viscosa]